MIQPAQSSSGSQAANPSEDASALLALETLVTGKVVHSRYVCPQVAPLGELYAAEATGIGLLSDVSRHVCVQGLLLGEGFATTATLIGARSGVGPLVFDQLTWLAEFLAVKLTYDPKAISHHWTFSFLHQSQAVF